ncbi:MAG TPA: hypothetical protein VFB06_09825 [Streptosporangiaceae bacterium]|nr:hypothetical protein [Streptosporangiaceae bacterium]
MEWPDPRDDHASDEIGSGEDSGLFALARQLSGRLPRPRLPQGRQGRWIVALLAGAVVAVLAVTVLPLAHPGTVAAANRPRPMGSASATSLNVVSLMTGKVMRDGSFAVGGADGRPWQMAVRNIADPGAACQPAVTVNGNDADPLFPDPPRLTPIGNPAFMTLGAAMPGVGFGFVQVPPGVVWAWAQPGPGGVGDLMLGLPPVTIHACGETFHLIGFAYPLTATLVIHETSDSFNGVYTVPRAMSDPRPSLNDPQVDGIWQDVDSARATAATAVLAAGTAYGQQWSIRLAFGTSGDCYLLTTSYIDDSANAQPSVSPVCGPVSAPQGPGTIVAMALGAPASAGLGIGYAVSLSPGTAKLIFELTSGQDFTVTPVMVHGRRYAAFFVPEPAHLMWINAIDKAGHEVAGLQDLPDDGYIQFPL